MLREPRRLHHFYLGSLQSQHSWLHVSPVSLGNSDHCSVAAGLILLRLWNSVCSCKSICYRGWPDRNSTLFLPLSIFNCAKWMRELRDCTSDSDSHSSNAVNPRDRRSVEMQIKSDTFRQTYGSGRSYSSTLADSGHGQAAGRLHTGPLTLACYWWLFLPRDSHLSIDMKNLASHLLTWSCI